MMLVVAADLFFNELEAAIDALKKNDIRLLGILGIKTFEDLDTLRT
jgi:hypothetical protein